VADLGAKAAEIYMKLIPLLAVGFMDEKKLRYELSCSINHWDTRGMDIQKLT
jgi:hypothetical protein